MIDLGGQTVTVIERVRGQHGKYDDGTRTVYPGCSLQPDRSVSESQRENRSETQQRWLLFGPPGLRANAADVCVVEPGPVDADGQPLRLACVGAAQAWPDENGVPHHVELVLLAVFS